MREFHTDPSARSSINVGRRWLKAQKALDWPSTGLPELDDWDQAIAIVARLVACSSAPMALMIGSNGILFANEAAERRLFTETTEAINGRSVFDVLPRNAAFFKSVLTQAQTGKSLSFREQALCPTSGDLKSASWFNLDFIPVTDTDGNIAGVLGMANDITPFVNRIDSLSDSEQRLRHALDGSGMVGIWTLDVATGISTADANVARIYGLAEKTCEEGINDSLFFKAIHPDDRERVRTSLAEAIASGTPYRSRYRIIDKNKNVRWVIVSAKPIQNDNGGIARLLGVVVEVTDQMNTVSALAESRFQFQTLTETLPQIVWSCDGEGRHDYFSARWSEFTGIEPADITEDTWKFLVYPEHQAMVASVWTKALRTGEAYDIDYRFRHRSGEFRWLRVMALPIHDDEGRIIRWFGTSTDVHDSYIVTEERERLAQELERIATEDQLTGAYTRRAFIERAIARLDQDRRPKKTTSLLMLDIDHFKSINDNYGHPAGDKVLAAAARRIKTAVREHDFVGRLGGEEFAVFLPQCSRRQAIEIAERIRSSIEENPILLDDGRRISITISIGATSDSASRTSLEQLLSSADQALYGAKSEGRNRVPFSAPALVE